MRIWSFSPKYLNNQYLTALWKEGIMGMRSLYAYTNNEKRGYSNHSQLNRFKIINGLNALCTYLDEVYEEANKRGLKYNKELIYPHKQFEDKIKVSKGQLLFEHSWYLSKMQTRDLEQFNKLSKLNFLEVNKIFKVVENDMRIEKWEKTEVEK